MEPQLVIKNNKQTKLTKNFMDEGFEVFEDKA